MARIDVPRSGSEGTTYEFRLTAVDKQRNVSSSTRLVSIPIDDANPLLAAAYGGGSWDAYLAGGNNLFQRHRRSLTRAAKAERSNGPGQAPGPFGQAS